MAPLFKKALRGLDRWLRSSAKDTGKATVLVDIANAFGAKTVAPIVLELQRRGHCIRVTGRDQGPDLESDYLSAFPSLTELFIHRHRARLGVWDAILFTDGPSASYVRWALRMRLPHGAGEGLYGYPHSLSLARERAMDVMLCHSIANERYLAELEPRVMPGKNVFTIGWPCLDELVQGAFDRTSILDALGFPSDRKTVLLTSHWTPPSILRTYGGAEVVQHLARIPGINVIVTGHSHLWNRPSVRAELGNAWYESMENTVRAFPHVKLVKTGDVRPLLAASDLMIGDRSSVTLEYSVLGRPIIQFRHSEHQPLNTRVDALLDQTVHRFTPLDELASLVLNQLAHPSTGAPGARQALVAYSFDHLGSATTHAADLIATLAMRRDFNNSLFG